MSLLDPIPGEPITPQSAMAQAAARVTPLTEYLGTKFVEGVEGTRPWIVGERALDNAAEPRQDTTVGQPLGPSGTFGLPSAEPRLDEQTWKNGPDYREGMKWDEGMTPSRAQALAARADADSYRASLVARYNGGLLGRAAGFVAGALPGLADPTNYVPILGEAAQAAMVARLGTVLGHGAFAASEAAANTALFEPLHVQHAHELGEDFGFGDAATDIIGNALAGSLFGLAHGGFAARREALAAMGVRGLPAQADAINLADAQQAAGLPVDVAPVLQGEVGAGVVPRRPGQAPVRYEARDLAADLEPASAPSAGPDGGVESGNVPGVAERARSDAAALTPGQLEMLQSGDMHAAGNRPFVRAFLASLPEGERGGMLTAGGELSNAGAELLRTAVLAKALGDPGIVARLAEGPESGLGGLGRALADIGGGRSGPPDFSTARPIEPHPSVAEAADRVGKDAPELATLAKDAGLEGYDKPLPGHEPKPEPGAEPANSTLAPDEKATAAQVQRELGIGYNQAVRVAEERKQANLAAAANHEPLPGHEPRPVPGSALPPELADIEAMRLSGTLPKHADAILAAGEGEAAKAEGWADAYNILTSCVLRNAVT